MVHFGKKWESPFEIKNQCFNYQKNHTEFRRPFKPCGHMVAILREASLSLTWGWRFLGGSDILYEKSGGSLILRKKSGGGYFARHMSKIFCYKNV